MDEQTYFTVQQVARRTGVTVRALHYYDQIGLLHPARVTQAGYRLYGRPELARLMQILFFRELEVPLKEIARLMAAPAYDSHRALEQHLHLLELKRKRLDRLIDLAGRALKGENTMQFDAFDTTEIQQAQAAYAREAQERWGGTDAWRESQRRAGGYSRSDWQAIQQAQKAIFTAFAALDQAPGSPEANELVRRWQQLITDAFYPCSDAILAGLGEMYRQDPRFTQTIDGAAGPGTAARMSRCIAAYCNRPQ